MSRRAERCDRPPASLALLSSVALLLAITASASPAQAQNCDALPGFVSETFPASGSRRIPRNGVARVLYCPAEDPIVDRSEARLLVDLGAADEACDCLLGGECLEVGFQRRCLEQVAAAVTVEGDVVWLETPEDLLADQGYVIEAPEPTGPVRVAFTTGALIDREAPAFGGLLEVDIYGCGAGFPDNAACPIQLDEEGFIAILRAEAAADVAGLVNIEYIANQDRGGELIERGRVRGDGVSDVTITVFIPGSDLTEAEWEQLCFEMTAVDPYGQQSTATETLCEFTPEFSPFGSACALAPSVGRRSGVGGALLVLLAIFGFRASSARSRRRSARRSA